MKRKIEQKRAASTMMQMNEEHLRLGTKSRSLKDDPSRPLMVPPAGHHDDAPYCKNNIHASV